MAHHVGRLWCYFWRHVSATTLGCIVCTNNCRFVGWLEFGFYFVPGNNEVSWRFPIAFQAIFPITVLCMMPFLVESPRWLLAKDRLAEGRTALAKLENQAEDSELVNTRVQAIMNSIYVERQGHTRNPFAKTPNRYLNRTLLAVGVNVNKPCPWNLRSSTILTGRRCSPKCQA
jgi:hypothetical protein